MLWGEQALLALRRFGSSGSVPQPVPMLHCSPCPLPPQLTPWHEEAFPEFFIYICKSTAVGPKNRVLALSAPWGPQRSTEGSGRAELWGWESVKTGSGERSQQRPGTEGKHSLAEGKVSVDSDVEEKGEVRTDLSCLGKQ